ncbi:ABC transporter substrate-binding protein [Acuticoccus sediminis]|uniref:ABC transporter substrate-binding protein n=1 Tax=Acuticoccus sediminis TaxID=2184697 RepID=A0A8B2NKY3_9HYPH|nr:ABC transporter substrate-binding protein [Acuticoccus sediminis]RAH96717.1 ABC transporter substrate-binding protein [Acuticoccus sediminis]
MKTKGTLARMAFAAAIATLALSAPAARAADRLSVALPAKMFVSLPEFVAQDKGFYADQDLEVSFDHIADSSIPIRSLISGSSDIIEAGMAETLIAIGRGAEARTIGGIATGLHYALWVRPDAGIESIEDFVGKNIAVSSPGSLPHVVILALLRDAGVPQDEIDTINWVAVSGSSARRNAILAGTVDATVASYSPQADRAEGIDMLSVVGEALPNYVMLPWDVSVESIEERRDVLKRFVTAELLATRFIFENEAEALEIAKAHFDFSDEDLAAYYDFYTGGIWNPNGIVSDEAATYMQQLNVDAGMQSKVLPVEAVLDQSILMEVLDELGRFEN